MRKTGVLLSFIFACTLCIAQTGVRTLPVVNVKTLSGKSVSTGKLSNNGKPIIISFWATWCKPCKEEHKFIEKFSKNKKIKVIGVNYKDNPKKTIVWLKEMGNPYSDIIIDKDGKIAIDWGVYGIPETFIINSQMTIKHRHVGAITNKVYNSLNLIIKDTE